ncbi:hypothetical protein GJV04_18615 [Enterobacteriaceae bacterium RIT714]|nr:hypothetical protein [Enterobacteriaceae bacterium RIT714]
MKESRNVQPGASRAAINVAAVEYLNVSSRGRIAVVLHPPEQRICDDRAANGSGTDAFIDWMKSQVG